jgi:hypothetical protein
MIPTRIGHFLFVSPIHVLRQSLRGSISFVARFLCDSICPQLVNMTLENCRFAYWIFHHICLSSWGTRCGKYSPTWYVLNVTVQSDVFPYCNCCHKRETSWWTWCGKYSPWWYVLNWSISMSKYIFKCLPISTPHPSITRRVQQSPQQPAIEQDNNPATTPGIHQKTQKTYVKHTK